MSFSGLASLASMITKTDFDGVSKMRDANKPRYTAILDVINQCNDFVDQFGVHFGDASTWQTDRALIIDSLSGLSDMASQMMVGGKPLKSQGEWQVAQNMLKFLIDKLTTGLKCTFILTSHIARERDEITGGTFLTLNTLGNKLAPELPKYFSDIIHCDRTVDQFTWDTTKTGMVLKARNVPLAAGQQPSFKPLI